MKAREPTIEIQVLDASGRWALVINGLIGYVGSRDECQRRADIILAQRSQRERQDQMLVRALR